jgi:hypothetical protein
MPRILDVPSSCDLETSQSYLENCAIPIGSHKANWGQLADYAIPIGSHKANWGQDYAIPIGSHKANWGQLADYAIPIGSHTFELYLGLNSLTDDVSAKKRKTGGDGCRANPIGECINFKPSASLFYQAFQAFFEKLRVPGYCVF